MKRLSEISLTVIFLVFLFTPLVTKITGMNVVYDYVQKPPVAFTRNIFKIPEMLNIYYSGAFGLRDIGVKLSNKLTYRLFGTFSSESILLGKSSWLFLNQRRSTSSSSESILEYIDFKEVSETEKQCVLDFFLRVNLTVSSAQIPFFSVVIPTKPSIYPEFLPDNMHSLPIMENPNLILDFLMQDESLTIFSVKDALMEAKEIGAYPLYHAADTHWNHLGAYTAYSEIMNYVRLYFPQIETTPLENYEIFTTSLPFDLARMTSIPENFDKTGLFVRANFKSTITHMELPSQAPKTREYVCKNISEGSSKPRLLVYCDSFSENLIPYLAEHFSESIFIHYEKSDINLERDLAQYNPDLVIFQTIDAYLPYIYNICAAAAY